MERSEAKKLGLKFYNTGRPCKHGHTCDRYVSNGVCLNCHDNMKDYRRDWERSNPDKISEKQKRRRSSISEYQRKYRKLNREETNRKQREYRRSNKEKIRAYGADRRARRLNASGSFSGDDIDAILVNQDGKCAEPTCRVDLSVSGYHVDHIMPLALGGSNWPDNLQCLCPSCNTRKGAKHPIDWARHNGRLL